MTTPDPTGPAKRAAKPASKAAGKDRVVRPPAGRSGPDRSGKSVKGRSSPPPPPPPSPTPDQPHGQAGVNIPDAVADAVKSSYDVLAETIKQGREAAERFRGGNYNVREVPGDVEHTALRLLDLARQLSGTTFDIFEKLIHQLANGAKLPPPGEVEIPAFPEPLPDGGNPRPPGSTPPAGIALKVVFDGRAKARSLTQSLACPDAPTHHSNIKAMPLVQRDGTAPPIDTIVFSLDLSQGGLVATITVPLDQAAGTYAGLIVVKGQAMPLGMLVIELAD